MKTFNENIFSDEDISQLADEILRIEYPIYDSTPPSGCRICLIC